MAEDDAPPEDENDDTGSDNNEEDEYTPPSKEEWEKVTASLARANSEAKANRLRLKEINEKIAAEKGKKDGDTADLEAERAKIRAEADQEVIRERAATRLAAAGLHVPDGQDAEKVLARAVRLLDLSAVTKDGGKIEGLSEAIEELREEMPSLFTKRKSGGVGSASGSTGREGSGTGRTDRPKTASQKLAERWNNPRG